MGWIDAPLKLLYTRAGLPVPANLSALPSAADLAAINALGVTPREEEPQISVPLVDILVNVDGYKAVVREDPAEQLPELWRAERAALIGRAGGPPIASRALRRNPVV